MEQKDIAKLKEKIVNFIHHKFGEWDRHDEDPDEPSHYSSYEKFTMHNKKCINKLKTSDLLFIDVLMEKINNNEIVLTDADNFVEWECDSFYFNKKGKLTLVHPR